MDEPKNKISLATPVEDLEEYLFAEENPENLKNLMELASLGIRKKDILRANKLGELQDKVVDEMARRLENKSGEFSNKDLLEFHKTIQDAINKASKDEVEIPTIQINQQQINIGTEEEPLSRESKARVADVIRALLAKNENAIPTFDANSQIIDIDISTEDGEN